MNYLFDFSFYNFYFYKIIIFYKEIIVIKNKINKYLSKVI